METKLNNLRPPKSRLPEVRCFRCNRLLYRGIAEDVEIKCSRCGVVQNIGKSSQESGTKISSW